MRIEEEFAGAAFGDRRLSARLQRVAVDLARDPRASLPQACRTEAATEATYRLLRNGRVKPEAILQPHQQRTAERAAESGDVIVAHDTTELSFSTNRAGLGRVNAEEANNAFFLHASLVMDRQTRAPLGVAGARRHVRLDRPTRKKTKHTERKPEPQRESKRWWKQIEETDAALAECAGRIHVCDREGDQYLLLARCMAAGIRFVIRGRHDRRVRLEDGRETTLRRMMRGVEPVLSRPVQLAPRAPKLSWLGTSKQGRRAKLTIRAMPAVVVRPATVPSSRFKPPETLALHVVQVSEFDPPAGFEPVDWMLLTTEPIDSPEQVARVVDTYDARWGIEEYFKALKTGCAVEARQLESATTIFNALALFIPIAVRLLHLKHQALTCPNAPATDALSPLHVQLLSVHPAVRLPARPTARDVWLGVARLGGHLKRNGPPGWQILWRGRLELERLVEGARLATRLDANARH